MAILNESAELLLGEKAIKSIAVIKTAEYDLKRSTNDFKEFLNLKKKMNF